MLPEHQTPSGENLWMIDEKIIFSTLSLKIDKEIRNVKKGLPSVE